MGLSGINRRFYYPVCRFKLFGSHVSGLERQGFLYFLTKGGYYGNKHGVWQVDCRMPCPFGTGIGQGDSL